VSLNISFRIEAIDAFSKNMSKVESAVSEFSDVLSASGKALAGFGAASTAVSSAVLGTGLNYLAGAEKAEVGLNTLTGSAEKTKAIMADLQDFATKTPFDFPGMLDGQRRLMGMGMSADEATGMLKATADAVAAVGGGSAELDGVVTALGQIEAKGKISAEEMNQLAERGIPAWKILGEEMGKTPAELMKIASEGKLLAKDALPALQKGFEETFGGAAAEQASSFSGRLSNLKENFDIMAGALAQPIFEPLSNAMGALNEKMQVFADWFKTLPSGVQTLVTSLMIILPVLTLLGGGFLMLLGFLPQIKLFFAATAASVGLTSTALLSVVGVVVAVVAALALIGVGLVMAYNKFDWFKNAVDATWAWIKNAWNVALTFIKGLVSTIMSEVSALFGDQLAKIKAFWTDNGELIMKFVNSFMSTVMNDIQAGMQFIRGVFQVIWPIISGLVKIAWGIIKTAVNNGVDIVLGLVEAGMKLLEGDWSGAWEAIEQIGKDIWSNIEDFFRNVDLFSIGSDIIQGLLDGLGSMAGAITRKVKSLASLVPDGLKDFLGIHSPSRLIRDQVGKFIPLGLAEGITNSLGSVRKAVGNMSVTAVPEVPEASAYSNQPVRSQGSGSGGTTFNQPVNVYLTYNGSGSNDDAVGLVDMIDYELAKRMRNAARISGIKI